MAIPRFYIDKIGISQVNMDVALQYIDKSINDNKLGYICVTNSRTTYIANKDLSYCNIQNNSLLTLPDGTPLVWIAHLRGLKHISRVSGPDLLNKILALSPSKKYSHYFFGSTPTTISLIGENLIKEFQDLEIKGLVSPPFQPLEAFDIDALANEINKLKPTFFWCGLGAPKQEKLIALLQPKLKATISIGVGLAFEYYAGTVKLPPKIISKLHLEWLYRCGQQPIKARRFIIPFFSMLLKLVQNFIFAKHFNRSYR